MTSVLLLRRLSTRPLPAFPIVGADSLRSSSPLLSSLLVSVSPSPSSGAIEGEGGRGGGGRRGNKQRNVISPEEAVGRTRGGEVLAF